MLDGILGQVKGRQAGGSRLAGLIDQLSPDGNVPDTNSLEKTLGALFPGSCSLA